MLISKKYTNDSPVCSITGKEFQEIELMQSFKSLLHTMVGQRVFVIATRYAYRGMVSDVGEDWVLLSPAMAVEQMGDAMRQFPAQENEISGCTDPIGLKVNHPGSCVLIPFSSIDMVFQPRMCHAPLPGEADYAEYKKNENVQ